MAQEPKSQNLVRYAGSVGPADREQLLGQRGCVLWMTGLSGSGKSTIAHALEQRLMQKGHLTHVLDGDDVRHGLNADMGFSADDRAENIRRIGQVAALFARTGLITITAFISPYRHGRLAARAAVGEGRFIEVFLDVPLAECEKRDPKGLYTKARSGEISNFTGIDAPYEPPEAPEVPLQTGQASVEHCVDTIENYLTDNGFLSPPSGPDDPCGAPTT